MWVVVALALGGLIATGCESSEPLADAGAPVPDFAPAVAPPDLAVPDLAVPDDLAVPGDLALPDDLAVVDLVEVDAPLPDLAARPDLTLVQPPGFALPVEFPVGAQPYALAVGDLDENGTLDLVTANSTSGQVSVLLGNGDGTFGAPTLVNAGANPVCVVIADINGDKHVDIVAGIRTNPPSLNGSVTVLFGDGQGHFTPLIPSTPANGPGPTAMEAVDVDVDGKLDLVMANNEGEAISFLRGNGDGTFVVPARLSSASGLPTGLTVGHFDGDDLLDVVTSSNSYGTVLVSLGQGGDGGTGTFAALGYFPGGGVASPFVLSHDVNDDRVLDLVVANFNEHAFSVLLGGATDAGVPNGSFGAPTSYTAAGFVNCLALADFDGDGLKDVVVAETGNRVAVFLANSGDGGTGGFRLDAQYYVSLTANPKNYWVATGDFNQDGKPDIVTTNFNHSSVGILLNQR